MPIKLARGPFSEELQNVIESQGGGGGAHLQGFNNGSRSRDTGVSVECKRRRRLLEAHRSKRVRHEALRRSVAKEKSLRRGLQGHQGCCSMSGSSVERKPLLLRLPTWSHLLRGRDPRTKEDDYYLDRVLVLTRRMVDASRRGLRDGNAGGSV